MSPISIVNLAMKRHRMTQNFKDSLRTYKECVGLAFLGSFWR